MTIQEYECPVHGRFELCWSGVVPDSFACPLHKTDPGVVCGLPSPHVISAPAVHTPDTRRRALTGHARDTNPW